MVEQEEIVAIDYDDILLARDENFTLFECLNSTPIKVEPIKVEENLEHWNIKNGEILIKKEDERSKNIIPEDTKTLIKIENGDLMNESVFDNETFKQENLNIKKENLEENPLEQSKISCEDFLLEDRDMLIKIENSDKIKHEDILEDDFEEELMDQGEPSLASDCFQQEQRGDETIYKCLQCDYQNIHKRNLNKHLLSHSNIQRFKCSYCNYQSFYRYGIRWHLLKHKNSEEVVMFKCDLCDYKTVHKNYLSSHMRRGHKNPDELKKFKCIDCDYETVHKRYLNNHMRHGHKNPEEVQRFKCNDCDYETVHKRYLSYHLRRGHKNCVIKRPPKNI